MFFKNKLTGVVWEVVHPDHIKRCQNDDNYEEVGTEKNTKTTPKRKQSPKKEGE